MVEIPSGLLESRLTIRGLFNSLKNSVQFVNELADCCAGNPSLGGLGGHVTPATLEPAEDRIRERLPLTQEQSESFVLLDQVTLTCQFTPARGRAGQQVSWEIRGVATDTQEEIRARA